MERIIHNEYKYNVISLFAGIGGFDLAFKNAGFNVIWANDFDKYAVQTYRENISNNIVKGDIRLVKETIPPHDILVGGFPCQPFSTLGKQEGFKDEKRGTLFFEIESILSKHNTKVVVLENVKNLVNHDNGKTFNKIISSLENLNYKCFYQVLNSQDYGLPQRRNRIFIVGFKRDFFKDEDFLFPPKIPLNTTTQDLLDENVDKKYFLSKTIIKTILGKGTKGYMVQPTIDLPICKTFTATMNKMHRASQDNYVTDNNNRNKFIDDTKTNIRKLTPNECRKIQGFPSDWKQVVSDTQAYKQFGNAVSVDVVYYIAEKIMDYMDKNLILL